VKPRSSLWFTAAAFLLLVVAAGIGLLKWHSARNYDESRLVGTLPHNGSAIVYLDFDTLRAAGLLEALAGSKAAEESDYRKFVSDSGFDYKSDLEAVAVAFVDGNMYATARGKFQWKRLSDYAQANGGSCSSPMCEMPASQPGRFISFYALRDNVIALAVSPDKHGADLINPPQGETIFRSSDPVALSAPGSAFEKPAGFPPGAQAFLSPLSRAKRVTFYAGSTAGDKTKLALRLDAECATPEAARDIAKQLQSTTELLKNMLAREKMKPSPADLSGLLVAGTFQVKDARVAGNWPLDRRFVEGLLSSTGE
jgi:hypothetical protein